jgi:hypothetical protein
VDTFAGKVQVKWAPEAEVSSLGRMPLFIEFLKTSGLLENWVQDCPLVYRSPNAPQKRGRAGHDSVIGAGRALALGAHQRDSGRWNQSRIVGHEQSGERGLGATCDGLYGHPEEARIGYNPHKPGRPSHAYHSYFTANLWMVLDVEVQPGNQTASSFAQPEWWALLYSAQLF